MVWIAAVILAALTVTDSYAQTCEGRPSFEVAPFQLSARGAFNDDANSFLAGASYGGRGVFGGVGVGVVSFDELDGSGLSLSAGAGYEASLDSKGLAYICPLASIGYLSGPKDIFGSGIDYSETDFAFGLTVGVVAADQEKFRLVPTTGVGFNVAKGKLKDDFGDSISETETFGLIELGVGFIFSQIATFKPFVAIPVGLDEASVTIALTAAVNLGRRD